MGVFLLIFDLILTEYYGQNNQNGLRTKREMMFIAKQLSGRSLQCQKSGEKFEHLK